MQEPWEFEINAARSIGGEAVAGADVCFVEDPAPYWGSALSTEALPEKQGTTNTMGAWTDKSIEPGKTYSILLKKEGFSSSLLQEVVVYSGMPPITLVLMPKGESKESANAPYIAETTFYPAKVATSENLGELAVLSADSRLGVKVIGEYPVSERADSFGVGMMINKAASGFGRYLPDGDINSSLKQEDDGNWATQVYYSFVNSIPNNSPHEAHFISLVAYDLENNRVEKRILFQSEETSPLEGLVATPAVNSVEMRRFAVDRQLFSEARTNTAYAILSISGETSGGTLIPYDGFEIWRSEKYKTNFKLVKIEQFSSGATPLTSYEVLDESPELTTGVKYYYSVRGFRGDLYSEYVELAPVEMLPALEISAISPVNEYFNPATETFDFQIKNSSLFPKDCQLNFSLRITSVDGTISFAHGNYIPLFIAYNDFADFACLKNENANDNVQNLQSVTSSRNGDDRIVSIQFNDLVKEAKISFGTSNSPLEKNRTYSWHIDGNTHGPKMSIETEEKVNGVSYKVITTSYASSIEYVGVPGGNSYTFTVRE